MKYFTKWYFVLVLICLIGAGWTQYWWLRYGEKETNPEADLCHESSRIG